MNIRPVENNFFRFTSKYGKRKLVIEIDGDSTKDELCEAFTAFLNASGYVYTDHIECMNMPPGATTEKVYEPMAEEDIPF
tara:strand:- start:42 stop:281 length:240 start_codon:yes stop_codon:yes gene_type:complete